MYRWTLAALLLLPSLAFGQAKAPPAGAPGADGTLATFSAAQDGAKCDGTTDDAAAINATLARIRAVAQPSGTLAWPIGHVGRMTLPKGQCLIKSSLNFTGLYGSGFVADLWGTVLVCQTNGTPCIDATGSGQISILGLNLYGSSTRTPNIGLSIGRITNNGVGADHMRIEHPTITGYFALTPFFNNQSETTTIDHAWFTNWSPSAYGAIFDGSNHFNVQSAFTGQTYPADTYLSFNEDTCSECLIGTFGAGSVPLWIGGTARHRFANAYIYYSPAVGTSPGPAVQLFFGTNAAAPLVNEFLDLDGHFEDFGGQHGLTSIVQFTGAASSVTVYGLHMRDNFTEQAGPIFSRSGPTAVTLQNAHLEIGTQAGPGASWWDSPAAFTVAGSVYSKDGTYTAPGSFTGMTCISGSCTSTATIPSALSVTSVAATTISGSAINSATFSNPGAISTLSVNNGSTQNSTWRSFALAGALPTFTFPASNGAGGGGTAALTSIVLYGTPILSGGVGCSAGDTFNLIDPQAGGNLVGGGTAILTASAVTGGAVTTTGWSATTGNPYLWNKPWSSGTAITARSSTCTTLPTLPTAGGYYDNNWSFGNGFNGILKAAATLTAAGSGYTAIPLVTPSPIYSTVAGASPPALTVTLSSALNVTAGSGNVKLDSTGTSLGVSGSGGSPTISLGALIDNSGVRQTLTTAGYTVPANTSLVRFIQGTTVTASTVTLPTALADGQAIQFVNYAGAITALTFSPAVNGWTNGSTLAANAGLRVRWDATAAAWYREQ